jgi:hypothetical protein
MKLTLVIAATLLAAAPAFAQSPQQPAAPKPTEAQVRKVVADISADKTKLGAYCALAKIQQQMGTLDEKKDMKKIEALGQQADAQAQKLGPDYEKVMDGLGQVDENSAEGKKLAAILATLDAKCK